MTRGTSVECGSAAERRSDTDDAAGICGIADRTRSIVSMGERPYTGCNRDGGATARSPGRSPRVPRIQRASVQRVVGEVTCAERWNVCSPDDDGSSFTQVSDWRTVCVRNSVLESDNSISSGPPRAVDINLDCDRDTVERVEGLSLADSRIGAVSVGERLVSKKVNDGIQVRVDLLEASDAARHGFTTRNLTCANAMGQIDRLPAPKFAAF